MLEKLPEKPRGFTISGGEPFLQAEELAELLEYLRKISDDIIIFTGYTYEELTGMNDPAINRALSMCSVLIDGPYIKEKHTGKGLRGSANQKIRIFGNPELYGDLESAERSLQVVRYKDSVTAIGIP